MGPSGNDRRIHLYRGCLVGDVQVSDRITETITASLSAATAKRPATGESIAADLRAAGFMILNRSQVEAGIREIVDGVAIDLGPYAGIVGPLARRIADVFERVEGEVES